MSLDKTLTEVRYAYRFLWEFQRRILDTVRLISDQFDDRHFYHWSNYKWAHGARGGTAPFNFFPEHFLPLYGASFLYLSTEHKKARLQPENWMLEMCVIPDTAPLKAFEAQEQFDPLELKFGAPEVTKSLIRLIAWKCEGKFPKNSTWFNHVWRGMDWPQLSADGEILSQGDGKVTSVAFSREMTELADRQQIIDFATEAKSVFSSKLDV